MENWDAKTAFRKYQVKNCKTIEEFLEKYYKHERYQGRGEKYAESLLNNHKEVFLQEGVDWISHHDSVTGQVVSFHEEYIDE